VIFDSWQGVGRVILVGTLAYLALLVILRMSGKRTLTKMNAFDLVVTVALGSTLATIVLSKDVALVEGVVAFALLIALQFAVTWLSVRSQRVRQLVKSEPTLLFYRGEMLEETLYEQRVTEEEVRAAIRAGGKSQLAEVEAVILETDGSFSVLGNEGQAATSARRDVPGYPVKRKLSA
jgi:uncharacterized membrane protein YcaP (DUF421 family)